VVGVTTSPSTGYTSRTINIGETRNSGVELDLKGQVFRNKNWAVDVAVRYSTNTNKAVSIADGLDDINLVSNSQAASYVKKGEAFPALRAVAYERDPATNRIIIDRNTGYPVTAPGLKYFGRTTPKDIIGVSTNVKFKQFSLSATAEYRGGHVIYNGVGRTLSNSGTGILTTSYDRRAFVFPNSSYLDNSGKYVPNTNIATQSGHYGIWVNTMSTIAENFVTSAAFWKLRDLSISYTVPGNVLKKTKVFKSATVGIFGRNLFMLVPKENVYGDPELLTSVASTNGVVGNGIGFNDTEGALPSTRSYGVTLNVGF
jgi:hypothetical protein